MGAVLDLLIFHREVLMPDNSDLLLNELLAESRSMRVKIDDIQADMVRKDDFNRIVDKNEKRLADIEDDQSKQKVEIQDNSKFISSVRWGLRVVAVAVLGVMVTAVSSLVHIDFNNSAATNAAVAPTNNNQHPLSTDYNNNHGNKPH